MWSASSRASWETWRVAGGDEEETQVSMEGRYRIDTVRGKQACCQTLRRSSGARLGKSVNVVAAFVDILCSEAGRSDVFDILFRVW